MLLIDAYMRNMRRLFQ